MLKGMRKFQDAMERGVSGSFPATDAETMKEGLAIALKARIEGFSSQQEAATAWGVSQPTVSYIVRGRLDRFKAGYLLDLLLKSGAKVELVVE